MGEEFGPHFSCTFLEVKVDGSVVIPENMFLYIESNLHN